VGPYPQLTPADRLWCTPAASSITTVTTDECGWPRPESEPAHSWVNSRVQHANSAGSTPQDFYLTGRERPGAVVAGVADAGKDVVAPYHEGAAEDAPSYFHRFLSGRPIGIRRASSRDDSDGQVPGLEAAFAGFAAGLVRVPADMSGAGGSDRDVTDGAEAALFGHDVSVNRVRPTIRGTKRWRRCLRGALSPPGRRPGMKRLPM
jgi:hypothetical protein